MKWILGVKSNDTSFIQKGIIMRTKLTAIFLLVALLMLTSCFNSLELFSASTQRETVETLTTDTTAVMYFQINPIVYPSIAELVKRSEIIVVGEVVNSSIKRIDLSAGGYVNVEGEMFANVSSFTIDVTKIIKGSVPVNMKLKVDLRCGGEVNGYYEIYDPAIPTPGVGDKCLFFIEQPERYKGCEYFEYMFVGAFDGFVKIENGKIIPSQNGQAVIHETTYDSLINEIEKSIC